MGVYDFLLGLVGSDCEPTVYITTRNGLPYVGETGLGLDVRYDIGDEERQNVNFTFHSVMSRKQRIVVEESLIDYHHSRGVQTDNYNRHSKQRKRGRG